MKNTLFTLLLAFMLITVQSCSLIGDIFQTGMWTGIIIVVIVVALIIFIIAKIRKKT